MTKALTNVRIEKDGLYFDVVTVRTEKLSTTDLDSKYIGIFDAAAKRKVFIVRMTRDYITCSQEAVLWPSWSGSNILAVLSKFSSESKIFIFDTPQELFQWLAK